MKHERNEVEEEWDFIPWGVAAAVKNDKQELSPWEDEHVNNNIL